MRPRKSEGLGGGWPLGRVPGKAGADGMLRRQAGAASKRPVTFLVRADCLLLPPSRFPDALGLLIITVPFTLHTVCNDGGPTHVCCTERTGNVAE